METEHPLIGAAHMKAAATELPRNCKRKHSYWRLGNSLKLGLSSLMKPRPSAEETDRSVQTPQYRLVADLAPSYALRIGRRGQVNASNRVAPISVAEVISKPIWPLEKILEPPVCMMLSSNQLRRRPSGGLIMRKRRLLALQSAAPPVPYRCRTAPAHARDSFAAARTQARPAPK